jgi:hypothetical protein
MSVGQPVTDVHIGIHPDHPVADTVAFARRVEAAGFGGLWVADSQDLFRDCFVSMTAVALATTTMALGTGVTNPVLRHPSVLAGAAASLDERTADHYVQEQLLGMVTDLDQVIAALRSMTFDLVPDSHNSQAALELVAEPPGSERL